MTHIAQNILRENNVRDEYYLESKKIKFFNKHSINEHKKIMAIFEQVSKLQPNKLSIKDNSFDITPEGVLVYGAGWCDSQAYVLANLLDTSLSVKTRLIDVQHHTTLEIFIDDGWKIYDSYFKTYILDEHNRLLSMRDIKNFTEDQLQVADTSTITQENVKQIYIPNDARYSFGEGDVLFKNKGSVVRKMVEHVIAVGAKIYGNKFLEFGEKVYLNGLTLDNLHNQYNSVMLTSCADCQKVDFLNYFKARVFLLTNNKSQSDRYLSYIDKGSYWKLRFDLLAAYESK